MIFLLLFTIVCASAYSGPYQRSSQRDWYNYQQPRIYQPRSYGSYLGQRTFNSPRAIPLRDLENDDAEDDLFCLGQGEPDEDAFLMSYGDKWIMPYSFQYGQRGWFFGEILYLYEGPVKVELPLRWHPFAIINREVLNGSGIENCPIIRGEVETSREGSTCFLYWFPFHSAWTEPPIRWGDYIISTSCDQKIPKDYRVFTFVPYMENEPKPHIAYKICGYWSQNVCEEFWIGAAILTPTFETVRDAYST